LKLLRLFSVSLELLNIFVSNYKYSWELLRLIQQLICLQCMGVRLALLRIVLDSLRRLRILYRSQSRRCVGIIGCLKSNVEYHHYPTIILESGGFFDDSSRFFSSSVEFSGVGIECCHGCGNARASESVPKMSIVKRTIDYYCHYWGLFFAVVGNLELFFRTLSLSLSHSPLFVSFHILCMFFSFLI